MTAVRIADVRAWEALDSRGEPTVAAQVTLADGATGTARVPAGASTGRYEARELRDGGDRYAGRGVARAVANVRGPIRNALLGADASATVDIDRLLRELDGTAELGRLGANAILAASVATALAAAASAHMPLYRWLADGDTGAGPASPLMPMPMANVLSGGAHAGRLLDVQDFLVVPVGARSFSEAIEWCWRVRTAARTLLGEVDPLAAALVADEGGLSARFASNRAAAELLARAKDCPCSEVSRDRPDRNLTHAAGFSTFHHCQALPRPPVAGCRARWASAVPRALGVFPRDWARGPDRAVTFLAGTYDLVDRRRQLEELAGKRVQATTHATAPAAFRDSRGSRSGVCRCAARRRTRR